jgi:hypothetical protein
MTRASLSRKAQEGPPIQLWRLTYPDGEWMRVTTDLIDYMGASASADRSVLATQRIEW